MRFLLFFTTPSLLLHQHFSTIVPLSLVNGFVPDKMYHDSKRHGTLFHISWNTIPDKLEQQYKTTITPWEHKKLMFKGMQLKFVSLSMTFHFTSKCLLRIMPFVWETYTHVQHIHACDEHLFRRREEGMCDVTRRTHKPCVHISVIVALICTKDAEQKLFLCALTIMQTSET